MGSCKQENRRACLRNSGGQNSESKVCAALVPSGRLRGHPLHACLPASEGPWQSGVLPSLVERLSHLRLPLPTTFAQCPMRIPVLLN